jgi:hypothetical protein
VLGPDQERVVLENAIVVLEPVLGEPAVHDGPSTSLVHGLSTQRHLGPVEEIEDFESLLGAQ